MEVSQNRNGFGFTYAEDGGSHCPEGLSRQRRSTQRKQPPVSPPLYQDNLSHKEWKMVYC